MTSRRFTRWCAALCAALVLRAAGAAQADAVSDAANKLQTAPVYLQDGASVDGHQVVVDQSSLSSAFGSSVKVAIFATGKSGGDLDAAIQDIARSFGSTSTVLAVFSGTRFDADSNTVCSAAGLLKKAVSAHTGELRAGSYTAALSAFAKAVNAAPHTSSCSGSHGSNTNSTTNTNTSAQPTSGGSSHAWIGWLVGLGAAAVAAIGALVFRRRRRADNQVRAAKANVMPYYDRLANEVSTLNAGNDPQARQAVADASERYTSAGSQMATATTTAQWAAIRRTTLEGLQAAQGARKILGLPAGPDVPPIEEPRGEQLSQAQQVTVAGQNYAGYPSYTPGAPYYFGGGGGYGGGWYTYPFWETMLIGSALGGGGGWGWGGGGYGSGYDSGYNSGFNAGENANNDAGGDGSADGGSNNVGGGDNSGDNSGGWGGFGGSGSDDSGGWGGFGGGGDFGSGGGDFGGGGGDFGGGGGGSDGGSF